MRPQEVCPISFLSQYHTRTSTCFLQKKVKRRPPFLCACMLRTKMPWYLPAAIARNTQHSHCGGAPLCRFDCALTPDVTICENFVKIFFTLYLLKKKEEKSVLFLCWKKKSTQHTKGTNSMRSILCSLRWFATRTRWWLCIGHGYGFTWILIGANKQGMIYKHLDLWLLKKKKKEII